MIFDQFKWWGAVALLLLISARALAAGPLGAVVGAEKIHRVVRGETLYTVAESHGLAMEHLAWANGLPVQFAIKVGKRLVLPTRRILPPNPPRDGLLLDLPERGVYLFRGGKFVRFYPVAVGAPGRPTPVGSFRIAARVKDPAWLPPAWAGMGEVVVPAGPRNPLGDRWIGLTAHGVGIHATNDPTSVGGDLSHGCIRTYPKLARDLFDRVKVGMPVRIEYQTARLGSDADANLYLTLFPDMYHRLSPLRAARRLLTTAGLLGRVDPALLRRLAARPSGRAVLLLRGR